MRSGHNSSERCGRACAGARERAHGQHACTEKRAATRANEESKEGAFETFLRRTTEDEASSRAQRSGALIGVGLVGWFVCVSFAYGKGLCEHTGEKREENAPSGC